MYILLPLTQAHTSSTYPPTPHLINPTHSPPTLSTPKNHPSTPSPPLPLSPLFTTPSPYIAISSPPHPTLETENVTQTPTYLPTLPTHLAKQNHRTKSPTTTQPNPYNPPYLLYPPPPPPPPPKNHRKTNQPTLALCPKTLSVKPHLLTFSIYMYISSSRRFFPCKPSFSVRECEIGVFGGCGEGRG